MTCYFPRSKACYNKQQRKYLMTRKVKQTTLQTKLYKGFKVRLVHTGIKAWNIEWVVTAVSPRAKSLMIRKPHSRRYSEPLFAPNGFDAKFTFLDPSSNHKWIIYNNRGINDGVAEVNSYLYSVNRSWRL